VVAFTGAVGESFVGETGSAKLVGEIDFWGQFHQHSTNNFCTHRYKKRKKD